MFAIDFVSFMDSYNFKLFWIYYLKDFIFWLDNSYYKISLSYWEYKLLFLFITEFEKLSESLYIMMKSDIIYNQFNIF
jgi:hypothetical protein